MPVILASGGDTGGYLSLAKIILMVVFLAPWLYAAPWASKDANRLKLRGTRWGVIILSGAALGWLLWVTIPIFAVGLGFYLLACWGPLVA